MKDFLYDGSVTCGDVDINTVDIGPYVILKIGLKVRTIFFWPSLLAFMGHSSAMRGE